MGEQRMIQNSHYIVRAALSAHVYKVSYNIRQYDYIYTRSYLYLQTFPLFENITRFYPFFLNEQKLNKFSS